MTKINKRILNHFMVSIPSGVVLTTEWLEKQGISPKLSWWYVHSKLLERVGMKAYKKAGDTISWAGAVAALQSQLALPLHVGGKTALQLLGRAHFIPIQGIKQVTLFADLNTRVPNWLTKQNLWNAEFEIFRTSLFESSDNSLGLVTRPVEGLNLQLSCPERAAMEMLYLLPKHLSLDEASLLMENQGQLRPTVVQSLLENCNSIKVKRLFLYFAEKHQHGWFLNLDLNKIYLGHGKRVIGRGGKYDSKYMLSLPEITEESNEF